MLSGDRLVHFHTHRADDIMTVLRLKREFGFDVLIQHGTETWKVAEELAEAGIPVSNITLDAPGGKLETVDLKMDNAGILERAGVLVSIHFGRSDRGFAHDAARGGTRRARGG